MRLPYDDTALSLTPAFKPVLRREIDISHFNGLRSDSYVRSFLLSLLDSPDWGTLNREKLLNKKAAAALSQYLGQYADQQGVYMKINFVNPDHVHALIDLPTAFSIGKVVQLLKGSSSHWLNSNDVITGKFGWGRGYGAFSVSESNVNQIAGYIAHQEEHHRVRTFAEELREFVDRHGLQWSDEKSR